MDKKDKIQITDSSGDRKYWTQIPNIIANHSTANDQALYFQMKRFAGENGMCFATKETLMKKMGIGEVALNKSIKYLLSKQWIKFTGKVKGKTRPISSYMIMDIWKLNVDKYKQIPSKQGIRIPSKTETNPLQTRIEEEPFKKNKSICLILKNWNERQTSPIPSFKPENIVNKHGSEKIQMMIGQYGKVNGGFSLFLKALK